MTTVPLSTQYYFLKSGKPSMNSALNLQNRSKNTLKNSLNKTSQQFRKGQPKLTYNIDVQQKLQSMYQNQQNQKISTKQHIQNCYIYNKANNFLQKPIKEEKVPNQQSNNFIEKPSKEEKDKKIKERLMLIEKQNSTLKPQQVDQSESRHKQEPQRRSNSFKYDIRKQSSICQSTSKFRLKLEQKIMQDLRSQSNNAFVSLTKNHETLALDQDSFSLDTIIGKGGYALVWKASCKKNKRVVAIKIIEKYKIIKKNCLKSILNERQILTQLDSKFIVNMICCFQNKDNLYIIMKYMAGGDLRFQIHLQRRFSERTTKFILACLILALEQLASKNILHRDIKPENIVIDFKGYLRLTDFGIARFLRQDNAIDTSGTLGYMSPEVIQQRNHSFTTDYFALGVLTFELMTGQRPFRGKNKDEIKSSMFENRLEITDQHLPFAWRHSAVDFINSLLQFEPTKRLGAGGIRQIKQHVWMRDVDWTNIQNKTFKSPMKIDAHRSYFKQNFQVQEDEAQNQKYIIELHKHNKQLQNYLKDYNFFQKEKCLKFLE